MLIFIRKGSLFTAACGWCITVLTATTAAFTASGPAGHRALAIEMLTVAVAITATIIYVLATLTAHIDDTQWAVGYSARLLDSVPEQEDAPTQGRRC